MKKIVLVLVMALFSMIASAQFDFTFDIEGQGQVVANPPGPYTNPTNVVLYFIPDPGWHLFSVINLDLSYTIDGYRVARVEIGSDRLIRVRFVEIPVLEVTSHIVANGQYHSYAETVDVELRVDHLAGNSLVYRPLIIHTVPEGAQVEGLYSYSGYSEPSVFQPIGGNEVNILWETGYVGISSSSFPLTVHYRLRLPAGMEGSQTFTAQVEHSGYYTVRSPLNEVVLQPAEQAVTLNGGVSFQGRNAGERGMVDYLMLTLLDPLTFVELDQCTVRTDLDGEFFGAVFTVSDGDYVLNVKGSNTLAVETFVSLSSQVPVNGAWMTDQELPVGDANGDNFITMLDFAIMAQSFGMDRFQEDFDPRGDFNGDGAITMLDFSLLANNFGQCGAGVQ